MKNTIIYFSALLLLVACKQTNMEKTPYARLALSMKLKWISVGPFLFVLIFLLFKGVKIR